MGSAIRPRWSDPRSSDVYDVPRRRGSPSGRSSRPLTSASMWSWNGGDASNASPMPSDVRDSIERGWRELAAVDEALERGEIDEAGWDRAVAEIVVPGYPAAA